MADTAAIFWWGSLAQTVTAMVLALLLEGFHRVYRRGYLRRWSWSWWALAAYQLGAGISFHMARAEPADATLRVFLTLATLIAGYLQAAWLVQGTWELTRRRPMSRRATRRILWGLLALALLSTLGTLGLSIHTRIFVRVGLRALVAGGVFVATGVLLLRGHRDPRLFGRVAVASGFLLYGLEQFHYVALLALPRGVPAYALYLPFADLVLQMVLALGMVTWLLEQERERATSAHEQLRHLALHDALTGLPNRKRLIEQLAFALERCRHAGGQVAVALLNLDRFQGINESLGHATGDRLLRQVAHRLSSGAPRGDTVARMGADELAVLLSQVSGDADALDRAEHFMGLLREPFRLSGRQVWVTASLGLACYPGDGERPSDLLRSAGVALAQAKEEGRDRARRFESSMTGRNAVRLELERDLHEALERGEMRLYYQPILDADDGSPVGVEALLRWDHPGRGLLTPESFLWMVEGTSLARHLDLWVLDTACRQVSSWHRGPLTGLHLSVNLSADLVERRDLAPRVARTLRDNALSADCLEVELTESLAVSEAESAGRVLQDLRRLGVRLAIDDFGTGYSSLSYLVDLPLDTLKMDRSFLRALSSGSRGARLPAAVVGLAHRLELGVVAEGVETHEQWESMRSLGCDRVQGFYFAPPLPSEECRRWLLARRAELSKAANTAADAPAERSNREASE